VRVLWAAAIIGGLAIHVSAVPYLPQRLSDTGLFEPGSRAVDPRNRLYSPQYPLWTDGARKARWIRLPEQSRIDTRHGDRWEFPVGTRLWKEFAFDGRRVETRLLWRSSGDEWTFASYLWNEAQTEAVLAPAEGVRHAAEVAPGKWHAVPSRDDCRACHDNGRVVLGVTALQLSDDRDPHAPHAEVLQPGMLTLRRLVAEGLVTDARPLRRRPPRIPGDARTRAALGYLTANCGHCHHDESRAATVRHPMLMPAFATPAQVRTTIRTLLAQTTTWDLPQAEAGTTTLLRAGAPEASAIVARMRSRRPSTQMPPLGTVLPDGDALDLLSRWIEALPAH
jgi:hypothetical protein